MGDKRKFYQIGGDKEEVKKEAKSKKKSPTSTKVKQTNATSYEKVNKPDSEGPQAFEGSKNSVESYKLSDEDDEPPEYIMESDDE